MKPKDRFIQLLGKDVIAKIVNNNKVEFEKKSEVYQTNEIAMCFKNEDDDGNEENFCQICYNEDNNEWFSINCIDYPHKLYYTFDDMKAHLLFIEPRIINKGVKVVNLS